LETEARAQSLPPSEWIEEPSRRSTGKSPPLKGRDEILDELREHYLEVNPLFIQGLRGVGTSAIAQEHVSELRAQLNGRNPVVIRVDVSDRNCPSSDPSYGVAATLLQHFQPDAPVKGSSRDRIMWWFLRRVMAEGRPVVVWLDQLRPNVRSLESVVGPLLSPGVLLNDVRGLPPIILVLPGSGNAGLEMSVRRIHVPPLPSGTISEVLEARARQTGWAWTPGAIAKLTDILAMRGNSLSVMDEILTTAVKRAGCHGIVVEQDVSPPSSRERTRASKRQAELRLLGVLRTAGGKLPMGQLVDELGRAFSSEGESAPSPSNVRRWTARLQALGTVKRSVAMGGDGGSRSMVSLADGGEGCRDCSPSPPKVRPPSAWGKGLSTRSALGSLQ
jgi:hypothetical protein